MIKDFVSIDFETMTPELTSACSIGMVKVINGVIREKYYSLIHPIPDNRPERNTLINHLTDEMVSEAPDFKELFTYIKSFIGKRTLVCHNRSTDLNILHRCMQYYNLTGLNLDNYVDTLEIYGKKLDECCAANGIVLNNHHDALADAEACAKLFLCHCGQTSLDLAGFNLQKIMQNKGNRRYEHDTLIPLGTEQIKDKNTPFYQKKIVITGTFDTYPQRNALGELLKSFGADMNTAISPKTDIVIVGKEAGPSKMKKIDVLKAQGKDIRIIYEQELKEILGRAMKTRN